MLIALFMYLFFRYSCLGIVIHEYFPQDVSYSSSAQGHSLLMTFR